MEAIILAAGYGTRLGSDIPKALLPVGGTPLKRMLDELEEIEDISRVHVVTNHRFHGDFERWLSGYTGIKEINLIDDRTTSNEGRLGTIGDLGLALERIDDDVLVLVSDRLFTEYNLRDFCADYREHGEASTIYVDIGDLDKVRGKAEIVLNGRWIEKVREKPEDPETTMVSLGFYIYPKRAIGLVRRYLDEGNNPDPPGYFLQWFKENGYKLAGFPLSGQCLDLGTEEHLREAQGLFGK